MSLILWRRSQVTHDGADQIMISTSKLIVVFRMKYLTICCIAMMRICWLRTSRYLFKVLPPLGSEAIAAQLRQGSQPHTVLLKACETDHQDSTLSAKVMTCSIGNADVITEDADAPAARQTNQRQQFGAPLKGPGTRLQHPR